MAVYNIYQNVTTLEYRMIFVTLDLEKQLSIKFIKVNNVLFYFVCIFYTIVSISARRLTEGSISSAVPSLSDVTLAK